MSEVKELREQAKCKDQQLEEPRNQLVELKKAQADSARKIFDLKAEIKHVERQWEKSAFEIKDNILDQAQVSSISQSTLRVYSFL